MAFSHLLRAPHCIPDVFDFLKAGGPTQAVIDARTPRGRASGTIDLQQNGVVPCITITIDAEASQ